MRITITTVARGMPVAVRDGDRVSYSLPLGFVLRRDGVMVSTPSPFVHVGATAEYRIDRETTDGVPREAVLDIARAAQ